MGPKLDEFEVISTIGSGAHGTVRKVRRKQDGEILVWKELNYGSMSEAEKQGLVLEVNLLRELRHPNIVKFLHYIVDRRTTTLYILMEYCPGGDLRKLISKCRQTSTFLEEGFIWRVLKQICEALKVCHNRDLRNGRLILHRDIKPANVFLDEEGQVKLGDFGLARTLNSEASFATTFVGTPYYMSPEVIDGHEYNERSDMWSLGCLMYELCTLRPPFRATTHRQLAAKIREARYDRIPIQYSDELQDILNLLLTYQDFLRPTAQMILYHSAVRANTASRNNEVEDDPLYYSLKESVLLNAYKKSIEEEQMHAFNTEGSKDNSETSNHIDHEAGRKQLKEHSTTGSLKENTCEANHELCADSSRVKQSSHNDASPLAETYKVPTSDREKENPSHSSCLVSNHKEDSKTGSAACTTASVIVNEEEDVEFENTVEKICKAAREKVEPFKENVVHQSTCEFTIGKLECVCGGMDSKGWRERVLALREAEVAIREREVAVKEREHEVSHRERRVVAMEKEARQHLVRAQIYLRQSRPRQNAATSPHRPPSDLDTTMSADPGDADTKTTTKLDPQRINNPFLEMRGEQQAEKKVSFDEKPAQFKSNTLDNPKSRRKRGNIFGLVEHVVENKKETKDKVPEETHKAPLKVSTNVRINQKQGPKVSHFNKKTTSPYVTPRQLQKDKDGNVSQGEAVLLQDPSHCLGIKSGTPTVTTGDDKENICQAVKSKKIPGIKPGMWPRRASSKNFNVAGQKELRTGTVKSQKRVLQFYNVV